MTDDIDSGMRAHVVAAVLRDVQGRVLLARRPQGKQHAGYWEFPGGKVEHGESPQAALVRELVEELGIHVQPGPRLITVPMGAIILDVFEVDRFDGEPDGRDGQALAWVDPACVDPLWMPPADRPALTALRLPDRYLIMPTPNSSDIQQFVGSIDQALAAGTRLLQLRLPGWSREEITALARVVRERCREHGANLLLNADWQLAEVLGLDGVHLPSRIAMALNRRPVDRHRWLAVSCHNAEELNHAAAIGADFATLSPVHSTPGHANSAPLGWQHFAELVSNAPMPVFALGGMQLDEIERARGHGGQGIAAIRSLWPIPSADRLVAGQ